MGNDYKPDVPKLSFNADLISQNLLVVPSHITHRVGGYIFDIHCVYECARRYCTDYVENVVDPHLLLDLFFEGLNEYGIEGFSQRSETLIESWAQYFVRQMSDLSLQLCGESLLQSIKTIVSHLVFGLLELFHTSTMLLTFKAMRQSGRRTMLDYVLKENTRNLVVTLFEFIPNHHH